jgi:hypothetical protein
MTLGDGHPAGALRRYIYPTKALLLRTRVEKEK